MMVWLKNASIAVKVALAPLIGVMCLVGMGGVAWYSNHQLGGAIAQLGEELLPRVVRINQLNVEVTGLNSLVNQSLAWEGAGFKADKIAALDKRIAGEAARVGQLVDELSEDSALDAREREEAAKLAAEYRKFRKAALDALDIKTGMLGNAASFMATIDNSYSRMRATFDVLVTIEKSQATLAAENSRAQLSRNDTIIVASSLVATLLAAAVAMLSSRLIVGPLIGASKVALAMSKGDFTVEVGAASRDATGQVLSALAQVSCNLSGMVRDIRTTAEQVSAASKEIAGGNLDLSRRTERTAAALQKTSASLEALVSTIRASAGNAQEANNLAAQARTAAHEGGVVVADVVTTMGQIDAQAKKIRDIIGVIDSIAFQTNILALNAAVEAARAGEQGRGFAVVANEVRSLAQRSAESAKEIRVLIGTSVAQVESGSDKVRLAGGAMQRIVTSIERLGTTVADISAAMGSQSSGIAEVNEVVCEMDRSTQQNAALVEQAAAATESLREQAHRLAVSIGTLRTF